MTSTLIIIPALNEQESIGQVLSDLKRHVPEYDVLVIDDGSTDLTACHAKRADAYVASLPMNLGIGAALRVGFRYAVEQNYDRVVQFDADGQHLASEIPTLIKALDAGAGYVVGSRFINGANEYKVGIARGVAMGILRFLLRAITGSTLTDTSSGFRGFSRPVIELFSRTYPREYMDSVEAIAIAARNGHTVTEVPVLMTERAAGVPSNRGFWLAYNYIRAIIGLSLTASVWRNRRMQRIGT